MLNPTYGWAARLVACSVLLLGLAAAPSLPAQSLGALPQKNVNIIGPTPLFWLFAGNPRMQQNEVDCGSSPVHPDWLFCGYNDYRGVNDPAIGDAFQGVSMSRDGGRTWISGLHPRHLKDMPNLNQKFAADPGVEALPHIVLFNFIAGWRDESFPGGVYVSRWYEHNREVGPPWEFLDVIKVATGTSGRFLDKPAFKAAVYDPALGLPPISVSIPAYSDPRNPANSHVAYTQQVPAARVHLCYAVFVGNDNNSGTKINCVHSDNAGSTWSGPVKLTESVEINQGVSVATRNHGQEVLAAWRRFSDNNETSAIMYALSVDFGNTWTKAAVLAEFCAFDQATGPARFRTNALPVAVSNGDDFAVYFASRNNATETCVVPPKGNKPPAPRMSTVLELHDFDSFGENRNPDGSRIRDGKVRTALNYSRIMMVREPAGGSINWTTPVMVDPQTVSGTSNPNAARKPFHQFMPAADAAAGTETVAYYDSRFDKLIQGAQPIVSGFVEDLVLNFIPSSQGGPSGTLLPAGFYELKPPPVAVPSPANNFPLRRNIDVMAVQYKDGAFRDYFVNADFYPAAGGMPSRSVRVSRFATRQKPGGAPGEREQLEYNYPNARLFRKGKAPFIGDYNAVFAPIARQREDLSWVSNQGGLLPEDLFSSAEPVFHVGWTSNHNVRGRVFYTGCDVWNESLQMWIAEPGCDSVYNDPVPAPEIPGTMAPLEGEDGAGDGPPLTCLAAPGGKPQPLTRNQNIFVAAMKPGVNINVVSAIKFPDGMGFNTFVLELLNGTAQNSRVRLELPAATGDPMTDIPVTFDRTDLGLRRILVDVPRGSGNARTVFDYANIADASYTPVVIVEAFDVSNVPESDQLDPGTGQLIARVPLFRESLAPLENVQNNDPGDLRDIIDPEDGEFYDVILKREIGTTQALDLENLDLENTVYMLDLENLDLENLDLENTVLFLDLENLDLENLDLENALYEQLDLENSDLAALDLENLDLENLDLENRNLLFLDLENLDLENLDLENLDLENFVLQQLDLENLDLENLDLENLDLENLDLENLDLENINFQFLDLENDTIYASDLENLDLENLDLENTAPGETYTEISWTADSATNTTTGVDMKPLFSDLLAAQIAATTTDGDPTNDTRVLLIVRKPYLTGTVQNNPVEATAGIFCTPQVVAENQLIFAVLLTPEQINSLIADPEPSEPSTPSFILEPDASKIITVRFINPPVGFDIPKLSRNTGMALYLQPGNELTCDAEIGGGEVFPVCEIDFINDTEAPVVTLTGADPQVIEVGSPYVELGATAVDDIDGDLTAGIVIDASAVDTAVLGDYSVSYSSTDLAGNAGNATRTVTVVDTTLPTITLAGPNPQIVEAGDAYPEQGATAADNYDGDLSAAIVIDASAVNTSLLGDYTVTYDVSDGSGNAAVTVARTVTVVDTTPPVITLVGDNPFTLEAATAFVDPGASAADPVFGDLTALIIVDASAIIPNVEGSYPVTYDVTDASGNAAATVIRTVVVDDSIGPLIQLAGDNPLTLEASNTPYTDAGASAVDAASGVVVPQITANDVNPAVVGNYAVTYSATDAAGNTSTATRVVVVADTTAPSLTGPFPPPPFTDPPTPLLSPNGTDLQVAWPITAADLEAGLTVTCTLEGVADPIMPTSTSYDPTTGIFTANFSNLFPVGETDVDCTVTDQAGLSVSTGTFVAFIEDTPEISAKQAILTVLTSGGVNATVTEAQLVANIAVDDTIDNASATDGRVTTVVCLGEPSRVFALGDHPVTCNATDSAGNAAAPAAFTLRIAYPYDTTVIKPKGNIKAGSTVPVDWYYTQPGTTLRINSSGFMPRVAWRGPFARNCADPSNGQGDGAEDSGSSSIRYSASDRRWRLNWQTPPMEGWFKLTVTPPGTTASTICVQLRP